MIARITHACELAPKGLYKANEENAQIIEFEDEFKVPEVAEMASAENWVHVNQHILNQGRCTHYTDPKLGAEELEALTAELAEKDPVFERLKSVSEDKPFEALGFASNYAVQNFGETIPVSLIGKQEGQSAVYGVVLLRNLVWPGAATVGYRGGWANVYVGYGHRLSQQNLKIRELTDVLGEPADPVPRPEPNPSKAPVPEADKKPEGEGEGEDEPAPADE